MLDHRLALHPQVALRPEPFGALAYHYDTRRLVFLKHEDLVAVVGELDGRTTVRDALERCGVDERRWPSFERALADLVDSDMLSEVERAGAR